MRTAKSLCGTGFRLTAPMATSTSSAHPVGPVTLSRTTPMVPLALVRPGQWRCRRHGEDRRTHVICSGT